MILMMCSVFDKAAEAYSRPQAFRSKGEAIRSFMDAVNGQDAQISAHRKDFDFYLVGTFADESGMLLPNGYEAGEVLLPMLLLAGADVHPEKKPVPK